MIRALLENGVKLKLLVLNQSEEKTSSASLMTRLQTHYKNANLSVEVRRHPTYSKAITRTQKIKQKIDILRVKFGHLSYKDALINNTAALPVNFENLIIKNITSHTYDIAWFNYMKMLPSKLPKTDTKIVIDMHDMQSERVKSDVLPTLKKSRRAKYLKAFINSEKAGLDACDIAISISPVETQAIIQFYAPKAKVITLKASDDPKPLSSGKFNNDIVFIGSNSSPNVDGLAWFINEVFPIIAEKLTFVRFLIQGNVNRNKTIKNAIESSKYKKNIIQQGFVESLDNVYQSAKVIICPIRYGTGMKIKVVEAMAYSKALVGTPVALEGIDLSLGLACETIEDDFAARTLNLITNEAARRRAECASKLTFEDAHSYQALKRDIAKNIIE